MEKILEIIGSLRIGGQEKVGREIGLHIDRDKYEIDYLVFDKFKEIYEADLEKAGIKVYHFPEPSKGYIQYLKNLKKLIDKNGYTIVHAHTMFNCGWAMILAWYMKVPCRISHSHSIKMADYHYSALAKIYQLVMQKFIHIFGTEFIGCGKAAGEWLFGKHFFLKHGRVIYNGIDTEKFKFSPVARREMRRKLHVENKLVIGHTGHFMKVKNQSYLISLMPGILEQRSDAILLLLGDGELKEKNWQECKRLGIEDKVIMTGNVSNVADYLSAMDVFVFPSLYEGMPLSIIEVQCNGLPCIISDTVPEDVFLTDLIRPLSLKSSKENWIREICDASRHDPEKYGKIMSKTGFDESNMLKNIYKIYDSAQHR